MWRNGSGSKNAAALMVHSQSPSSRREREEEAFRERESGREDDGSGVRWGEKKLADLSERVLVCR